MSFLWHLHQLNNIDKHRMVLTVGSQSLNQSMPPSRRRELATKFLGLTEDAAPDGRSLLTELSNRHFPLKVGDKLCSVARAEVEENMYFTFDMAFAEPEALRGQRVVATLTYIANLVRDIVYRFDSVGLLS